MPSTARRLILPAAFAAASVLALAGCSAAAAPTESASGTSGGTVAVVASTNVWGEIAQEIGGDHVTVTSIVSSAAQDPHSFEASARDQLAISRAALIIENGGGYDSFMDSAIEATGADGEVITAVEYADAWADHATDDGDDADEHEHDHGDHDHVEGFNEHVWYDPTTVGRVADEIAEELGGIDPANKATYTANAKTFAGEVDALETQLRSISEAHAGEEIFVTEPVPLYLTQFAGLVNVAPDAFTEAVEEGQDVPPATLLSALALLTPERVQALIVNAQTGGAETTEAEAAATKAGIPVLKFTETLPDGKTWLTWMTANADDLNAALDS